MTPENTATPMVDAIANNYAYKKHHSDYAKIVDLARQFERNLESSKERELQHTTQIMNLVAHRDKLESQLTELAAVCGEFERGWAGYKIFPSMSYERDIQDALTRLAAYRAKYPEMNHTVKSE